MLKSNLQKEKDYQINYVAMSAYPNIQEYHNFRPKNTASLDILYVEDAVGLCKKSIWGMFVTP